MEALELELVSAQQEGLVLGLGQVGQVVVMELVQVVQVPAFREVLEVALAQVSDLAPGLVLVQVVLALGQVVLAMVQGALALDQVVLVMVLGVLALDQVVLAMVLGELALEQQEQDLGVNITQKMYCTVITAILYMNYVIHY